MIAIAIIKAAVALLSTNCNQYRSKDVQKCDKIGFSCVRCCSSFLNCTEKCVRESEAEKERKKSKTAAGLPSLTAVQGCCMQMNNKSNCRQRERNANTAFLLI